MCVNRSQIYLLLTGLRKYESWLNTGEDCKRSEGQKGAEVIVAKRGQVAVRS